MRDIFSEIVSILSQRYDGKTVKLTNPVCTEMADDSDWHRTKKGYMVYGEVVHMWIAGKHWMFACGSCNGQYPAYGYSADLFFTRVSDKSSEEEITTEESNKRISEFLRRSKYFRNTLMVGLWGNKLYVPINENWGSNEIVRLFNEGFDDLKEHMVQEIEVDQYDTHTPLVMMGVPAIKKPALYKHTAPTFLADLLESVIFSLA